nr:DUF4190 domain-containing protein [Luteimonas sp. BDR2-5]
MAVASLVFGLLGWVGLPLLGGIVAVVTGHMARAALRRLPDAPGSSGMAVVGLALGYASFVFWLLAGAFVLWLLKFASLGSGYSAWR